jgi:hypothetical protein
MEVSELQRRMEGLTWNQFRAKERLCLRVHERFNRSPVKELGRDPEELM